MRAECESKAVRIAKKILSISIKLKYIWRGVPSHNKEQSKLSVYRL
jgi:hypothetical protein